MYLNLPVILGGDHFGDLQREVNACCRLRDGVLKGWDAEFDLEPIGTD